MRYLVISDPYMMATASILGQPPRVLAGATTIFIALIVITPLCGLMFDCGCTWPWEGLHRNCNYYDPQAIKKCPWCVSLGAGFSSVVLSIICGFWVSIVQLRAVLPGIDGFIDLKKNSRLKIGLEGVDYLLRVCSGLLAFFLVSIVSGWASASWQGNHFFLG